MREKITFTPGQKVIATLDQNAGKPVDGRSGPQYMRVVDNDSRIMFIEPALEQAISESGAGAGDVIQILQIGKGKAARWDVGIVSETREPARPHNAEATPPAKVRQSETNTPAAPARQITRDAIQMTEAYAAAIEATAAAEAYATLHNLRDLRLSDPETITRLAITVYIQRGKEGR